MYTHMFVVFVSYGVLLSWATENMNYNAELLE